MILWNTRYLQDAFDTLGQKASAPSPALLRHVAPLGWEHISLTGDYIWTEDTQPAPGLLRPLRQKPSLLAGQVRALFAQTGRSKHFRVVTPLCSLLRRAQCGLATTPHNARSCVCDWSKTGLTHSLGVLGSTAFVDGAVSMAPNRISTDNDEIRTFDLAHAPIELQASPEAQHLVNTSSRNPPVLQVWMGSKTLALKPPTEGQLVTQVTAWEFNLYRWLTRLGLAPGQTAYVVWTHSTHAVSDGNHLLANHEAPNRPDAVQPQPFSDIVRHDSLVSKATMRTNEKSSFHRLIYQSRSTLAGQPVLQLEALRDILFWAKRRNGDLGVSGILLYNQLDYLQVLEGVRTRVDWIFRSVLRDRRHTNIVILQRGPVDGRIFHFWSMAYKELPYGTTWPDYSIHDFPTQLLTGDLNTTPGCLAGLRHSQ